MRHRYSFVPNLRRPIVSLVVASCVLGWSAPHANAQNGGFLQGLLKELLESEMERRRQRNQEQRPLDRPLFVPQDRPVPRPQDGVQVVLSPRSKKARRYFESFNSESRRLLELLQKEARTVPGLRPRLTDVVRLRSESELLMQRYAQPQPDRLLLDDIRALDQDWRSAAYGLNQLSISAPCKKSIARLDDINQQCCALFNLSPQINRREVVRLADSLASELYHLERDVEYELRGRARYQSLILNLRRMKSRAQLMSDSVAEGANVDAIVAEFKHFLRDWNELGHTLEAFNDRHIDRTIEQIHEVNRAMHQQLRMPLGIDRGHIEHLATITSQRVKTLCDTFSLTMLTELPDGPAILTSAKALTNSTTDICTCITKQGSRKDLTQHWQNLDSAWREFDHYSQSIKSPTINNLRQEIESHLHAMRDGLGVQVAFDRRQIVRLVSELEGIAEQAQYHVQQWQQRPGARQVDAAMMREAKRLIQDCHELHVQCSGKAGRDVLARDVGKLARNWSKLRPQLMACDTIDKHTLRRISDEATSRLIRLQAMLDIEG